MKFITTNERANINVVLFGYLVIGNGLVYCFLTTRNFYSNTCSMSKRGIVKSVTERETFESSQRDEYCRGKACAEQLMRPEIPPSLRCTGGKLPQDMSCLRFYTFHTHHILYHHGNK